MPQDTQTNDDGPLQPGRSSVVRFASQDTIHTLPSERHRRKARDASLDQTMHRNDEYSRVNKRRRLEQGDDGASDDSNDDGDQASDDDDDALGDTLEGELHRAIEERRKRRSGENADDFEEQTRIDRTTSLAAEGIAFEPFNMDREQSDGTGYFDGDTYVFRRRRSDDEEPDAWLESLQEMQDGSRHDVKDEANESETDETSSTASAAAATTQSRMDSMSIDDLYAAITPLLSEVETITQAIIRYGNLVQRKPRQSSNTKGGAGAGVDGESSSMTKEATKAAQQALNVLTEAASALLLRGHVDIYQKTRGQLLRESKQSTEMSVTKLHGPENVITESGKPVLWEYQGSEDGQIHGPYSTQNMRDWIQAGYFVGPSAVKVRSVMQRERTKSAQEDLLDDLESDGENEDVSKTAMETVTSNWMLSDHVDFSQFL